MSIFRDLKNFLSGKKSDPASDTHGDDPLEYFKKSAEKTGHNILDKAKTEFEKLADQADQTADILLEKYKQWQKDIANRSKDFEEEISDQFQNATEEADERLETLRKRAEELRRELNDDPTTPDDEAEIRKKMQDLKDTKDDIEEQLKKEAENIRSKSKRMEESFEKEFDDKKENFKSNSGKFKEKAGNMAESLFGSITASLKRLKDETADLTTKLEKKSEQIQIKAHNFLHEKDEDGKSLMDEAKETLEKLKSTWADTMSKAQDAATEDAQKEKYQTTPEARERLKKSELDDKDEFWRKAEAFAAGDYDRVKSVKIEKSDPEEASTDETSTGEEWIDDATILDEEE